jgi:hypothetical protein
MNLAQAYSLGRLNLPAASSDAFRFAEMLRSLHGCMQPPARVSWQDNPGSVASRVIRCLERSKKPKLACQIRSQLRLDYGVIANVLRYLVKRGAVVRTNATPPYLYRARP